MAYDRWTEEETLRCIRARVKFDDIFINKTCDQRESWERVAEEARLDKPYKNLKESGKPEPEESGHVFSRTPSSSSRSQSVSPVGQLSQSPRNERENTPQLGNRSSAPNILKKKSSWRPS